jgi:Ser/Thr protein kinase RdoA (MazF antagonist)
VQWNLRSASTTQSRIRQRMKRRPSENGIAVGRSLSKLRVCHAELLAEHILVDRAGEPLAVIDWGDVTTGPWWQDFVGLWGGDARLESALRVRLAMYERRASPS